MQHHLISLLLLVVVILISGCGWKLVGNESVPCEIKTMIFESYNSNNFLSRMIRKQLQINGIKLVERNSVYQTLPVLHIIDSNFTRNTISIIQNESIEEQQVILSVSAILSFPGKDHYPINIKVCRSFFSNPKKILAQDAEQQIIFNEMHNEAVIEMIRKLSHIKFLKK